MAPSSTNPVRTRRPVFELEFGGTSFPTVAPTPTLDDAIKALGVIEDALREFPFVDDVARSVASATILTAVVRRTLRTAPMIVFDAPRLGRGRRYWPTSRP